MPPVVVEGTQAKKKSPKKNVVAKKKAQPAPAPVVNAEPAPAPAAEPGPGQGEGERGNGPVEGYTPTVSATATKTDTPILETPQSISVVTQDQIADQQARTVNDALRYTPGVSLDGFGSGIFFDSVKIRGFAAPQYLDGLRLPTDGAAFAVARIDPYMLERLEVLKGPSSGLYGQSDPGGLINMVSKRPLDTAHVEVQGTTGSFDRVEGAFDVGGPVARNPHVLYRVVGLARESDTQVDFVEDNKLLVAPSLTIRPSADTTFTLLSQYQRIDNDGYQQYVPGEVTLLPNPNGRIPLSRYLGEPGFDHMTMQHWSIGYELEHRISPGLQFRQNLRYMDVTQDLQAMRGDFRTPIYTEADARNLAVDNQLQAKFESGPLRHTMLLGVDYQNTRSSNHSHLADPTKVLPPPFPPLPIDYSPIDVYNPVYGAPLASRDLLLSFIDINTRQEQTGIYLQDQIKFDRWTLSLTGRQDWSDVTNVSDGRFPTPGTYERQDSAQTGRVGLSYLFDFGLAPYASYSTSFVPNIGAGAGGKSFAPTTGEGKEVGLKFMPNGTNLMMTASLFDIEQQDILTTVFSVLDGGFVNAQTDAARVRGYEFEVRGNITPELQVAGGYSKLDPEITKSSVGDEGNYLPNVNLETASLWAKYTFFNGPLAGVGVGGGVRYVGENYGDNANTIYIPDHTLFDASVSYDFAYLDRKLEGWEAQVNATNLEDEYYVASCQAGLPYCGLGNGRMILAAVADWTRVAAGNAVARSRRLHKNAIPLSDI